MMRRTAPSLSMIVPTFDRQALTEAAIESVLRQNIEDLEVLVVDDGSRRPFQLPSHINDPRVCVIRHDENRGAAAARNTGLEHATGEFISFLDSDDLLVESSLRLRLFFARERSNPSSVPVVFGCGFSHFRDGVAELRTRVPAEASTTEDFASGCWFCPGSSVMMRREVALAVGPQDTTLRRLEDYDWFVRLGLMGGRLIVQPLVGALIRVGATPAQKVVREAVSEMKRKWLAGNWQLSSEAARKMRAYLQLESGATALRQGSNLRAAAHLASSLFLAPRFTAQLHPVGKRLN